MLRGHRYRPAPVAVRFVRRLHRFGALVRSPAGTLRTVHVPNPGRMGELLRPGREAWVVASSDPGRRTAGTLVAVRHRGTVVSIDTMVPNRLVAELLREPDDPLRLGLPSGTWRAEVQWGTSRFDFALPGLSGRRPRALLEVKSANLRVGNVARFPDAPTVRGVRHLRELARAASLGIPETVLYVVQRDDVRAVGPNPARDPDYAAACARAEAAGVRFRAVGLRVAPGRVRIARALPTLGAGS